MHCGAGLDFARYRFLLCGDSGELFATPLVGFVEVNLCAKKASAEKRVAFAPDCIFFIGFRQQLRRQELCKFGVTLGCHLTGSFNVFLERFGHFAAFELRTGGKLLEESFGRTKLGGFANYELNLSLSWSVVGDDAFAKTANVAVDCLWHRTHALCEILPVVFVGGW